MGVKGKSGLLRSMESRAAFLHDHTHHVVFYDTPKHAGLYESGGNLVEHQVEARRRQNQVRLMAFLHEEGVLRSGLSFEEATDVLWALSSYDLYGMLVVEQRWEPERYESLLALLLVQHLLASR